MAIAVRRLSEISDAAWDKFVEDHPDGTFFHRAAWADVLSKAFGHTSLYAATERDGSITGVLPLVHVNTLLFGNKLISTPFCVYGGPLSLDPGSEAALIEYSDRMMTQTRASVTEYRFRKHPGLEAAFSGWHGRDDLYVTFRKPIDQVEGDNFKRIPRKQRAMVRKGIERGLQSRATRDVVPFYAIYAESVRNLGTPVFSRRYFDILRDVFREQMDITTVFDGDRAIAAVLNFYDRNEVLPYYGGGTPAARTLAGSDFMYWEVMRRAASRGCVTFDFGRSKVGTGAFSFKRNWGFSPEPLFHRYKLRSGSKIPEHNPLNPKYRLLIAGWKRLPLPIANGLGPLLVPGVG